MPVRTVGELVVGQDPLSVARDLTVRAVVLAMKERKVGAVGVVEADRLIGLFTERDVMLRVVAEGRDPDRTRVDEVMTANPQTLPPHGGIGDALERMLTGHFRHVPVVVDGRFVGMVSLRDIPIEHRWMRENYEAARRQMDPHKAAAADKRP
jgi:CBS domain-containing protein